MLDARIRSDAELFAGSEFSVLVRRAQLVEIVGVGTSHDVGHVVGGTHLIHVLQLPEVVLNEPPIFLFEFVRHVISRVAPRVISLVLRSISLVSTYAQILLDLAVHPLPRTRSSWIHTRFIGLWHTSIAIFTRMHSLTSRLLHDYDTKILISNL